MLWDRVGTLVDQAPGLNSLRHHRLHLVAADRMRSRGQAVPEELIAEERHQATVSISTRLLLQRIRAATDAQLLLMKGPEVATFWPAAKLRPWKDLDLLVADAPAVQRELRAAGFVEVEDSELYKGLHHLGPLALPGIPLTIEVHSRPHWLDGDVPGDILDAAVPSALGVEGILAPALEHHVVMLAAHAWAHRVLDRLGWLVDIAALLQVVDRSEASAVAESWGLSGVWNATARAVDEVIEHGVERGPLWRRHLNAVRERTVFEEHVARITGAVIAAPPRAAPVAALEAVTRAIRPYPGESWAAKVRRTAIAARNAGTVRSAHEAALPAPLRRTGGR